METSSTHHIISSKSADFIGEFFEPDNFETDDLSMFLEHSNKLVANDKLKDMRKGVVGNCSIESDADGEKKDDDVYLQPSQMYSHKISMSPPPSDNMMDQIMLGDGGSTHSYQNVGEITLRPLVPKTSNGSHEHTNAAEKYAAMARTSAELANTIAISARVRNIVNLNATVTECGAYQWPDGSVYEGDWRCGRRHGKGIILYIFFVVTNYQ